MNCAIQRSALHLSLPFLAACAAPLHAGPKLTFDDGKKSVEILQSYQVWGAATLDPLNVPVADPRADLYLRRARLGLRGQAYPRLEYLVWLAYDNIGKDPVTGSIGTPQVMPNTTFQAWDAYFTWRADSTWANISFGLMRPQVGNEFNFSFSVVPSLEKALTHYYVRDHLHTRPSGRETGLNLGGFKADTVSRWALGYNVGIFDAAQEKVSGAAAGSLAWSPLLTGKLSFTLGDPENKDYRPSFDPVSFGKRTGVTVSAWGSWQGHVDERMDTTLANPYIGGFEENKVLGASLVLNWRGLELDGEVDFLNRRLTGAFPAAYAATRKNTTYVPGREFDERVWHMRGGYSIPVFKTQFVEPALMYSRFDGDESSLLNTDGEDEVWDAGVNWHVLKSGVKVSLHYVMQDGEAKSSFTQGPDRRGTVKQRNDYLALGLLLSI